MKRTKRILAMILSVLLLGSLWVLPAGANSAQTHWHGVDSTGVTILGGDCPIEVKKEVLTFDLSEFPESYYSEPDQYLAYTGKVTAEYTFYNPTDATVTARLAFPFGTQPDYAWNIYDEETDTYLTNADTEKYEITLDGEPIEKRVRYTYSPYGNFTLENDLPRLHDGYRSDGFYSPETTVTKYIYHIRGIDTEKYSSACVAFDWRGDGRTRIFFPDGHGFHSQKNGDGRFSTWADNGESVVVYAIGQPFSSPLPWKCYEDGGVKNREEIDGTVTLTRTETTTLEELVLTHWDEECGVSKIDWYNAAIDSLYEGIDGNSEYGYASTNGGFHDSTELFLGHLMRWYEYEITVSPKESVVNTVTAPMYPAIDENYAPAIFTYTYFLSPASTWANFGSLEIVIRTPFYMIEQNLDGFEKTADGYVLRREGLPSGELTFTLCTSENPTKQQNSLFDIIPIEVLISFSIIGAVLLLTLLGGGVAVLLILRKKKKNRQEKN